MPETVRATGVDIAQSQVAYALEHYNSTSRTFQLIGPGQLPFEDSSFDLVTSIELIEHISMGSARQLLKESIRVLVPGGRIAISTPNYRSLWPLLEILVSQNGALSYADQHITQYTRAKLRALLTETGFVCVQVDAYQLIAPFAAALSWSLADIIATVEPAWLTKMAGLLLFGSAQKPQL
jgi:2-polyprenyl-3-methyl-5-hydroxy-6-metoxy-1,4-benzoquinol methylase